MSDAVARCVRNSLHWYEAIFRTHGLHGEIVDGLWMTHGEPPPYYSRAMTLAASPIEPHLAVLRDLRSELPARWSIKDSFAALDLAPLGFEPLFDADWISRDPLPLARSERDDVAWRRVTSTAELDGWETTWRDNGSPTDRRVFQPALLADPTVALFAAYAGDVLIAGCAANRSADAVGFSNFFVADGDDEDLAAGALAAVSAFGDGVPVVGYEWGDALERAQRLGFDVVGPLRVWETVAS
jgi:hypothetical protein